MNKELLSCIGTFASTKIKIKKFTYSSCSIINISINIHENNSYFRGEISGYKVLKKF